FPGGIGEIPVGGHREPLRCQNQAGGTQPDLALGSKSRNQGGYGFPVSRDRASVDFDRYQWNSMGSRIPKWDLIPTGPPLDNRNNGGLISRPTIIFLQFPFWQFFWLINLKFVRTKVLAMEVLEEKLIKREIKPTALRL